MRYLFKIVFELNDEINRLICREFVFHRDLSFMKYHRIWCHTFCDPNISTDELVFADDGFATENGCVGVNHDLIFDGWMTFLVLQIFRNRKRT